MRGEGQCIARCPAPKLIPIWRKSPNVGCRWIGAPQRPREATFTPWYTLGHREEAKENMASLGLDGAGASWMSGVRA